MNRLTGPVDKLSKIKNFLSSDDLNVEMFNEAGVYIVKGLLSHVVENKYSTIFENFSEYKSVKRNKFNPVVVNTTNTEMLNLAKEEFLLEKVKKIFGNNIGLYNFRLLVKDSNNTLPVFLHNDICYHSGYINRISAFVALSNVNSSNGGLSFILGTHNFGLLGDAGEINIEVLQDGWPILQPDLMPGDVVFMHSSLWHLSGDNTSGEVRALADIHYQPANDPTTKEVLCGAWQTEYRFPLEVSDILFKRSRVSRIKELEGFLTN